jgi:hypothetical protein
MFSANDARGDLLRYAVAFGLMRARKIVRGLREGLTEDERYAVADQAVSQLKQHGDPGKLPEEAKPTSGPTT